MKAVAAALLSLAVAAFAPAPARSADRDYGAPGPFSVRESDLVLFDRGRQREIPVRVRIPAGRERVSTILFSHGLGGSLNGGMEWGEHWASHGFVVIHVQHPGSDESIWKDKPVRERIAGFKDGADLQQFLARIADIKFVLDELARRQGSDDPLGSRIDLTHVGMSGHSFGAVTTLYLGGQRPASAVAERWIDNLADPRFSAFLAMSPRVTGDDPARQLARFARPALLMTGTRDGQPFPSIGVLPEQRLAAFRAMPATGNKFLLVVDKADHMFFNGQRGLRDIGPGRHDIDFTAAEARGYPLVKAVSTAYWDAYLRGDEQAMRWLREGGAAALAASDGYLETR